MSSGAEPTSPPENLGSSHPEEILAENSVVRYLDDAEGPEVRYLDEADIPNCDILVTEDDTPMDNLFSEKQMRLLVEPLHSNWNPETTFVAMANIGFFHIYPTPATVPDVLVSMHVTVPQDQSRKENRSYFMWTYGKPPEIVIEIVSNKTGDETGGKLKTYESVRVTNYVIYDPLRQLSSEAIQRYELRGITYQPVVPTDSELVGLGLRLVLWTGRFEDMDSTWLRWADLDGKLIPTGFERSKIERARADTESQRADMESQRANANQRRIEELEAMLRNHGIDPPVD